MDSEQIANVAKLVDEAIGKAMGNWGWANPDDRASIITAYQRGADCGELKGFV